MKRLCTRSVKQIEKLVSSFESFGAALCADGGGRTIHAFRCAGTLDAEAVAAMRARAFATGIVWGDGWEPTDVSLTKTLPGEPGVAVAEVGSMLVVYANYAKQDPCGNWIMKCYFNIKKQERQTPRDLMNTTSTLTTAA